MTIRLTPGTATAGGTKVFEVVGASLNTANGQLTLTCRDGQVCLELVGQWELAINTSSRRAMSIDEVARLHDGQSLVTVN